MRFFYGKNDWKTMERGEENCYLMGNGLGGYSSLSLIASVSRNDQALFMACVHAPNQRINMIHRVEEHLQVGEESYTLSSQRMTLPDAADMGNLRKEEDEQGYCWQSGFEFETYPKWTVMVPGIEVKRSAILAYGENTIALTYEIRNRTEQEAMLNVKPWLIFLPKGERLSGEQKFFYKAAGTYREEENCYQIRSGNYTLFARTNGVSRETETEFCRRLYYVDDVKDGKMERGRCAANHEISFTIAAYTDRTLEIVFGMNRDLPSSDEVRQRHCQRAEMLQQMTDFSDVTARHLALSADAYIAERASTGKKTILAGYPFFEDWGRDTMIALPGCCLSTGRYDDARSILETFLSYCKKGLMPNLFPEGTQKPWYNTADAALLFILAVYGYEEKTKDLDFVKKAYPIMEDIMGWYKRGTDYHIHMDTDGLIMAGADLEQVTWMDVCVEGILPTPRHGKPVEINAYWYNALRMMERWQKMLHQDMDEKLELYGSLADKVKKSFNEKFWNEEKQCLKDVISGTDADDQIRCNQIWAVAQPFSILPLEREKKVVECVYKHLYTPYGLRTLSWQDPQFHAFYGGAILDRDLAYHQGTVWVFPLGAYLRAYLKVSGNTMEAREYVKEQLKLLIPALREGCTGHLPEIYDGGNQTASKGCFAQAWSVGEILRVYDELRQETDYEMFKM